MSKLFSFKDNSSFLRFGLMPWLFQNMFVPMKANIRYLSREMAYKGGHVWKSQAVWGQSC